MTYSKLWQQDLNARIVQVDQADVALKAAADRAGTGTAAAIVASGTAVTAVNSAGAQIADVRAALSTAVLPAEIDALAAVLDATLVARLQAAGSAAVTADALRRSTAGQQRISDRRTELATQRSALTSAQTAVSADDERVVAELNRLAAPEAVAAIAAAAGAVPGDVFAAARDRLYKILDGGTFTGPATVTVAGSRLTDQEITDLYGSGALALLRIRVREAADRDGFAGALLTAAAPLDPVAAALAGRAATVAAVDQAYLLPDARPALMAALTASAHAAPPAAEVVSRIAARRTAAAAAVAAEVDQHEKARAWRSAVLDFDEALVAALATDPSLDPVTADPSPPPGAPKTLAELRTALTQADTELTAAVAARPELEEFEVSLPTAELDRVLALFFAERLLLALGRLDAAALGTALDTADSALVVAAAKVRAAAAVADRWAQAGRVRRGERDGLVDPTGVRLRALVGGAASTVPPVTAGYRADPLTGLS